MKRKIICLLMVIACLVTLLASCKDKEPDAKACEAHIDADKNSACDNCGIPVINTVEKVPTEQQVIDMIVAAIPENATLGTVYSTSHNFNGSNLIPTGKVDSKPNEYINSIQNNSLYAIMYTTKSFDDAENDENDKFIDTYKIFDASTGRDILTASSEEYKTADEAHKTTYAVDFVYVDGELALFEINKTAYTKNQNSSGYTRKVTTSYYTTAGIAVVEEEEDVDFRAIKCEQEIAYVEIDEVIYAIDYESGAILHSEKNTTFIYRPVFTKIIGNYGYIETNETVYVFDLTKWIECTYSYEIPASYTNGNVFYLANGKLLVQGKLPVANDAVNFDLLEGDIKYDVKYVLVDPAAKSAAEIEFGYYITSIEINEDDMYTAAVKNIVNAMTIEDKAFAKSVKLYTDDALTILAENSLIVPDFVADFRPIANNRFLALVQYGEGSQAVKIYNELGAVVATLPNNAQVRGNYIFAEGKFYDFNMTLAYDPGENSIVAMYNQYIIIQNEDGDMLYWTLGLTAPVVIADATNTVDTTVTVQTIVSQSADYFVIATAVTTTTAEGTQTVTTYALYNAANQLVLGNLENNVSSVDKLEKGDITYYAITLNNDDIYFAR